MNTVFVLYTSRRLYKPEDKDNDDDEEEVVDKLR